MQTFQGLSEDTYRFFWEIAFHNEIGFFEQNRKRYEEIVKKPMLLLADALQDAAREVDPQFVTRPGAVLSRIRRDTRYAKDVPFRDHAYISYRHPGVRLGESLTIFVEFERNSYGFGMGIYSIVPQFMKDLRKRILAQPEKFKQLIEAKELNGYALTGEAYKKPQYIDAPAELQPWLNKRRFYYSFSSDALHRTMQPDFVDEARAALKSLKPLYRFIMNMG